LIEDKRKLRQRAPLALLPMPAIQPGRDISGAILFGISSL